MVSSFYKEEAYFSPYGVRFEVIYFVSWQGFPVVVSIYENEAALVAFFIFRRCSQLPS
jgi:hypothetical protein